jgi:copper homeostasis protein
MAALLKEQPRRRLLEVCVDSVAGLKTAMACGADRIELCAALDFGGLTPSAGFMAAAVESPVPVISMVRPRGGDFVFDAREVAMMVADIERTRTVGLSGVVLGASLSDGRLDRAVLSELVDAAEGLDLTLHRAFDLVPDADEALELAISLGFSRILTSGFAQKATWGVGRLHALAESAAGRISIMPGAGIDAGNASTLLAIPEVFEVHASCRSSANPDDPRLVELGFSGVRPTVTDAAKIVALKEVLTRYHQQTPAPPGAGR